MKITAPCSGCGHVIASDESGRLPPWCPRCGATLKKSADAPRPAAPGTVSPRQPDPAAEQPASATAEPVESLPYFHACVPSISSGDHELFRVYLAERDLIVLRLGVGDVNLGDFRPRTRARYTGGGLAGAAAQLQEMKKIGLAKRIEQLEGADEERLRMFAAAADGGFTAGADDLQQVRIDPPSWWYRCLCSVEHYAVLKFRHTQQGRMALALPSLGDTRRAVEGLTELFGDLVQVNLTWGAAARRAAR